MMFHNYLYNIIYTIYKLYIYNAWLRKVPNLSLWGGVRLRPINTNYQAAVFDLVIMYLLQYYFDNIN